MDHWVLGCYFWDVSDNLIICGTHTSFFSFIILLFIKHQMETGDYIHGIGMGGLDSIQYVFVSQTEQFYEYNRARQCVDFFGYIVTCIHVWVRFKKMNLGIKMCIIIIRTQISDMISRKKWNDGHNRKFTETAYPFLRIIIYEWIN